MKQCEFPQLESILFQAGAKLQSQSQNSSCPLEHLGPFERRPLVSWIWLDCLHLHRLFVWVIFTWSHMRGVILSVLEQLLLCSIKGDQSQIWTKTKFYTFLLHIFQHSMKHLHVLSLQVPFASGWAFSGREEGRQVSTQVAFRSQWIYDNSSYFAWFDENVLIPTDRCECRLAECGFLWSN